MAVIVPQELSEHDLRWFPDYSHYAAETENFTYVIEVNYNDAEHGTSSHYTSSIYRFGVSILIRGGGLDKEKHIHTLTDALTAIDEMRRELAAELTGIAIIGETAEIRNSGCILCGTEGCEGECEETDDDDDYCRDCGRFLDDCRCCLRCNNLMCEGCDGF